MEKLKIGDTVQVMSGAERSEKTPASKRGKVLRIDREKQRVAVEGLRVVKRHLRKTAQNPEGGIVEKAGTVAIASVAVVCAKCDKPTRVGIRMEGDAKKRFCKNCDAFID
jgi:large subunit ribosomal protein L24